MFKKSLSSAIHVVFLVCLLVTAQAPAQQDDQIVIGTWHTLHSDILDEDREIIISTPLGFAPDGDIKYPVIYLLDGLANFHHLVGTATHMNIHGQMPPVIVVAIPNVNRMRDFTPPRTTPSFSSATRR